MSCRMSLLARAEVLRSKSSSDSLGAINLLGDSAEKQRVQELCKELGITSWQESTWTLEGSKTLRASSTCIGNQYIAFLALCIG